MASNDDVGRSPATVGFGVVGTRIRLPEEVARIYDAVAALEARYPGRRFTPDGHLVGSLGEVVAAEALGLTLHPASHPGHDAFDDAGQVQIKMTGPKGREIAFYATCERLVVLRILTSHEAEIVYDGPGAPAWAAASGRGNNGQRKVTLSRLRAIAAAGMELPAAAGGHSPAERRTDRRPESSGRFDAPREPGDGSPGRLAAPRPLAAPGERS